MAVSESFASPRLVDEAFQSRVRQNASIALWNMFQRVEIESGDKVHLALTVETPRGAIVDRRSFVAPTRMEK